MFTPIRTIHFSGICGTAMASLAAALKDMGCQITGSDQNVYPPMSTFLANKGIEVMEGYSERNLAHNPDLVVIGNALSRGNPEVEAVLEKKLRYCSMPELIKEYFLRGKRSIVITGTHGKTTTTALLAWVFEHNGLNPGFLIGGIPINFGQGARFTDSDWFIIEGDEYDTAFFDKRSKFMHYLPEIAVINNIEFDHADIFENLAAIQKSFRQFINLIPRNGLLVANGDDPNVAPLLQNIPCPLKTVGFNQNNAIHAFNIKLGPTASEFETPSYRFHINLVGEFNIRNALSVVAVAKHCGLSNKQIQSAFDTFRGVKRRMEIRGVVSGITIIDDFGHHPTAIRETLKALRLRYAKQKIWALFEPRSNTTRRNIFQNELPFAFADADFVVIGEVNRANQLSPSERLDPVKLVQDLQALGKTATYIPEPEDIAKHVARNLVADDVIVIFSNGSFGGLHTKLMEKLRKP